MSAVADIVFRCTSTLHDFEGHVATQPFLLLLSSNTWSAQAEVFGHDMTTRHEKRDRNMWVMFETNRYPRLSGVIRQAPRPTAAETNGTLNLRIRDRETAIPVIVSGWSETPEGLRFHAAWDVSLKQYQLAPPSVLGILRVGDIVHLEAEVTAANVSDSGPTMSVNHAVQPKP